MRVPLILAALAVLTSSATVAAKPTPEQMARLKAQCPRTTSYLADESGLYQGKPLAPRKLTELPPATAYMAVYRLVGVCEYPMTMAEYRNPRAR